jgi:hypothetical protein
MIKLLILSVIFGSFAYATCPDLSGTYKKDQSTFKITQYGCGAIKSNVSQTFLTDGILRSINGSTYLSYFTSDKWVLTYLSTDSSQKLQSSVTETNLDANNNLAELTSHYDTMGNLIYTEKNNYTRVVSGARATAFVGKFGFWRQVATQTDFANTPEEFALLQHKYPDIFGSYDPSTVATANITVVTFQYDGESSCPAGDPRLTYVSKAYGLCLKGPKGNGICSQSAVSVPPMTDPCQTK